MTDLRRMFVLAGAMALGLATTSPSRANDYPTVAVADYVVGCMISNGVSRAALERCSCSIDVISTLLTYDDYVRAETFARMSLTTGERSALFRETAPARQAVTTLRRAQAEADIRCF